MFPTAVLLLVAAPPVATSPAGAFRQAERLYATERFGEAEPLYRAALETDDRFLKRETYNRLMNLYVRTGRPDKGLATGTAFRAWLQQVGDTSEAVTIALLTAQFQLELGYVDAAEKGLAAVPLGKLTPERRLDALRLRSEIAIQKKDNSEKSRWGELEKAAASTLTEAENTNDTALRVVARRAMAEARFRLGDTDGALSALAPVPELNDKLEDPFGRRDTQRQRAKLLAAKGQFADAAKLFQEALDLHRKNQPKRRLLAGDVLAEWSTAALAAGKPEDATKLRDAAVTEYRAALDAPPDAADADGGLAAFVRLQALTRSAKQFTQALDVARNAGERWAGDPLLDARLKADRGGLELLLSSYQAARKLLTPALADLETADPPNLRTLPKVLVNLATAELGCDAPERAEPLLSRCAELYRKYKLPSDAVRVECDYLSGVAAGRRGAFADAISHFRSGLALCDAVGTSAEPVRFNLWLNIALIHKEQGDAGAAGESLKSASAVLARGEHDDLSAALIDAVRADLFLSQGQIGPALKLVPNLEAACAKHGRSAGYLGSTARHVRALDLLSQKKITEAEAIWTELADAQRKDGNALFARSLNFLGICAELRGSPADAVKRFEEARAFQSERPRCPPVTRVITLWRLAVLTDKAGKRDEAKKLLTEVFDVADRARLNTFGEAAQRAQFFAQFAPAFEMLAAWCARDNDGEGVLRVVTRSRSRTLLDQMLAAGVDPRERLTGDNRESLLAREANARRTVSRLRTQAMQITGDQADEPAAKKLLAELETAQKDYADAWREIANADPLTRVLTDPAFAETSLAQVRKETHKSGGVLLTYMVGRDASFAVLCTDPAAAPQVFRLFAPRAVASDIGDAPSGELVARAGFRGIALKSNTKQPDRPVAPPKVESVPLTDTVATRLVNHYLQQIADPSFNPTRGIALVSRTPNTGTRAAASETLGDAVLPHDLREKIRASRAKRIVLVPDGALHKLPFEALTLSAEPEPRYALDELPAVCYAPSLAALAVVLNRPRVTEGEPALLTVGDPAYPESAATAGPLSRGGALPRLPYTATESKKVRQYFAPDRVTALEQADATEVNVVAALPGKRFIHLAAHGFADEAFGNAFAAVALTPPARGHEESSNDGFLTLHEISRLKLAGCELTVLSACVTNVGPQRPLEAGVTLAGAFLGAGSRGVMASCWSVDDRATAEMMAAFFSAVRPEKGKGAAYPEALKNARLAVRGKPGWEAPFFWAPFVYVGPPD